MDPRETGPDTEFYDNQDVPHRMVVSGVYELPFGRGRRPGADMPGFADAVLGGWAIGSIVSASSGRPYNVITQGNPANTGNIGVVNRPNISGDPYSIDRTVGQDFDTSVFTPNAQYTIGSAGRNILRQRSQFGWDFSALKDFRLAEQLILQFRFEAFQFTNTPRFGQAGNTLGTNAFGQITGAATPRNLQFGLKMIWKPIPFPAGPEAVRRDLIPHDSPSFPGREGASRLIP